MDEKYLSELYKNVWFSKLPYLFQKRLIQDAVILNLDKDQTVFFSGDVFNGIYAVLQGSIYLGYIDVCGNAAVSAIVEPIMWFGEISLVDLQPRSHDAIALQKTVLLHIPSQKMQLLLEHHPEFWFHIAQLTSQKLRYAFLELVAIQTQTLRQRLAQRLLFILNGYGNHLNIEQHVIHLSQEQLAHLLMCSRQTINQELHFLEKNGILKIAFKKIEILDVKALQQLVAVQQQ